MTQLTALLHRLQTPSKRITPDTRCMLSEIQGGGAAGGGAPSGGAPGGGAAGGTVRMYSSMTLRTLASFSTTEISMRRFCSYASSVRAGLTGRNSEYADEAK